MEVGEDHGIALDAQRAPSGTSTSTAVYADGPHAATRQYEIGDAGFGREKALTFDLGLRRTAGPRRYEISAYLNRYDGYIYLADTGLETPDDEALPVFQFTQRDATFRGFEASVEAPLELAAARPSVRWVTTCAASCRMAGATCLACRRCGSVEREVRARTVRLRV